MAAGPAAPQDAPRDSLIVHGTAVAAGQSAARGGADLPAAVLVIGAPGSGKSALALQLMALGARLVADDRTIVTRLGDDLRLTCPDPLAGLIEARGVGLLRADAVAAARLTAIVDLDRDEAMRLPPRRSRMLLGCDVSVLHKVDSAAFPAAIWQYIRFGRQA